MMTVAACCVIWLVDLYHIIVCSIMCYCLSQNASGTVKVTIVIHYSWTPQVGIQLYDPYFRFTNLNV